MSNWKSGWCIGDAIETLPDNKIEEGLAPFTDNPIEIANHLDEIFRFLGKEDSDIVYLFFLSKKRQVDICRLMNKTQPAISYDIKRVKKHIDFVFYLVSVIDEYMEFLEKNEHGLKEEQINILTLLFFSTSFTKTSEILNCHQITCRNRFNKTIEELREKNFENIVQIFEVILNNLNMIKKKIL